MGDDKVRCYLLRFPDKPKEEIEPCAEDESLYCAAVFPFSDFRDDAATLGAAA
jgi:hypothetical protein